MKSWHNDIVIDKLEQIQESIGMIELWCKGYVVEDDFLGSSTGMAMLDASILRLQIIGEAVRAIDSMTQGKLLCNYDEIPWRNIIGLRNIISHDYASVNYTMIIRIIKNNLHPLSVVVRRIIEDLREQS